MAQNLSKINFQKHRVILASFFPPLDPQKRENKNSVKDFGGRQQERAPGELKLAVGYTHGARAHLLGTIFANSDVEKALQLHLTGMGQ